MHKSLKLLLFLFTIAITTHAQKLPNKQETSVWAPANIKVGAKAGEWNNSFQAYNHATEVFYTIANNNNDLYLIINANDATIIKKIIYGNISVALEPVVKDKNATANIVFPLLAKKDQRSLISVYSALASPKSNKDSLLGLNREINSRATMKITGIDGLTDSIFSINNAIGIQMLTSLNEQSSYTCEVKIPIKLLAPFINKNNKINYNIKLNGQFYNTKTVLTLSADGKTTLRSTPGYASVQVATTPESMILDYPTDFWGEYTLTKKP